MPFAPSFKEAVSDFLTPLKKDSVTFKIISDVYSYYSYWNTDNKEVRSADRPEMKDMIDPKEDDDGEVEKPKHTIAFVAIDDADGLAKLATFSQAGIKKDIEAIMKNAGWGEDTTTYKFTINKTGSGLTTKYQTMAVPDKTVYTPVDFSRFNLDAFIIGEDVFTQK